MFIKELKTLLYVVGAVETDKKVTKGLNYS